MSLFAKSKLTFLLVFLPLFGFAQFEIPYYCGFESEDDMIGWQHYALTGNDDWEFGSPNFGYFTEPIHGIGSAVTNLNGDASQNSDRILETPSYDLTGFSQDITLAFFQRRYAESFATSGFFLEYSIDDGTIWEVLLSPDDQQTGWQTESIGFGSESDYPFQYSNIGLNFLQDENNVSFRFRFINEDDEDRGWMIDDFYIRAEYIELEAYQGNDTIWGLNKYFNNITMEVPYSFSSDFYSSKSIKTAFFLSTDSILGVQDIPLDTLGHSIYDFSNDFTANINFPEGLSAGYHNIIYQMDILDSLQESSELNNISFATFKVDSIYSTPYYSDFETPEITWGTGPLQNNTSTDHSWFRGNPNFFLLENARSGNTGWHSGTYASGYRLESPVFDLSESEDNVICFWYRSIGAWNTNLRLWTPFEENELGTSNDFFGSPQSELIRLERHLGWDCYCQDISEYDNREDFRFILSAYGSWGIFNADRTLVDDVYVGPAKPDLAVEGEKKFRFSSSDRVSDTLNYKLFNGGLSTAPSSMTNFYWSADEELSADDILLGTHIEPEISDTSFVDRSFVYQKQDLNTNEYYIIYVLDSSENLDEMSESDNIGSFRFEQSAISMLPYYNDFENEITSWTHGSSLGHDEWSWAEPVGEYIDSTFSGIKAMITNDTGAVSMMSRMHLMTPIFDLTQLAKPVLEFNMNAIFAGVNGHYNLRESNANVLYSIDGGNIWQVLTSSSSSFRRLYDQIELGEINPIDYYDGPVLSSNILYGKKQPTFLNHTSYQGRDFDNIHQVVIDIDDLKNESQVRFMFVHSNYDTQMEGILIDDFQIKEAENNLMVRSIKSLMKSSQDTDLKANLILKNDANFNSPNTIVEIKLSQDDILDESDLDFGNHDVPELQPYEKFHFNIDQPSPNNFEDFNYLLLNIDSDNSISETIESDNIVALPLSMDTASFMTLPILNDFEGDQIDGWAWRHDSTGFRHAARFRHIALVGDRAYQAESGTFFLDPMDRTGTNSSINWYPKYFLTSPAYDFSGSSLDSVSFDFRCIGTDHTNLMQGANLQYSTDGGLNWIVLGEFNDNSANNWYDEPEVYTLNDQPGWVEKYSWQYASKNISFLSGESYVKFRFQFKSISLYQVGAPQGFRLDNFTIHGETLYTLIDEITICENDSAFVFNDYIYNGGLYFDSLYNDMGEDSVIAIQVNVTGNYSANQTLTACYGEPFTFPDGTTSEAITSDTLVTNNYSAISYCDSTIHTQIEVLEIINTIFNDGLYLSANQENAQYQWLDCNQNIEPIEGMNNITFQPELNGLYALQITLDGCIDTTDCFDFELPYQLVDEITMCDGDSTLIFNDYIFDEGLYLDTLISSLGEDSIIAVQISILDLYSFNQSFNICAGEILELPDGSITEELWNDTLITTNFNTINFCDSIIFTQIEISQIDTSLVLDSGIFSSNQLDAQYQWLDCNMDLEPVANANNISYQPEISGSYSIEITLNGCIDTTACYNITIVGLIQNTFNQEISVYPNPTNGNLIVRFETPQKIFSIRLLSLLGQELWLESFENSDKIIFPINQFNGLYFLEITNGKGNTAVFKVRKE